MARTPTQLKKPTLATAAVLGFAEGKAKPAPAPTPQVKSSASNAPAGQKSGLIPEGDVRLTANIAAELHTRLKIRAALERTTVGELIEEWIKSWPPA